MTLLILLACSPDIDCEVAADEDFVHLAPYYPGARPSIEKNTAPESVDVSFSDGDTADTGVLEFMRIEGSVPAGAHTFQVKVLSGDDVLRRDRDYVRVLIQAD